MEVNNSIPELTLQRIPISVETDNRLRMLKARTGVNPNIICRISLCLSLEEKGRPNEFAEDYKSSREINRYTLMGKFDQVIVALLKTWIAKEEMSFNEIDKMFLAHINRGVGILAGRIKSISDFRELRSSLSVGNK